MAWGYGGTLGRIFVFVRFVFLVNVFLLGEVVFCFYGFAFVVKCLFVYRFGERIRGL